MDRIAELNTEIEKLSAAKANITADTRKQSQVMAGELLGLAMGIVAFCKMVMRSEQPTAYGRLAFLSCFILMAVLGADVNRRIGDIKSNNREKKRIMRNLREITAQQQELQSLLNRVSNQSVKGK